MENADVKLLTYSEVLEGLKAGKSYARAGWNGKGLSISLAPDGAVVIHGFVLQSFFVLFNTITMTANTWVASVSDTLAEDWYEVV
ncbi:hypothetical protein pEaSNUABM37_00226 [Erwinia phage pEa_SNUABM_37]|nr:hypothetical protein pEaSNUABM37_00226 [Erwinia phage pEa_SNUABM_37]QXO10695.1 hypothetical protein pEaSNUABM48_00226 [Erwinia phage pEa_SNUABM_48]